MEKKRSKTERLARRWAWLKGPGGYVHYMPYYFSSEPETLKSRLQNCQRTWEKERKGNEERWRGIGCGERHICPVCGSYRQWFLAKEAVGGMLFAQSAVELEGVQLGFWGLKFVLTIPKQESERIDALLFVDTKSWLAEVNRLYKAVYAFIREWFGSGVGGVVSLDYTGESAPSEPHYHFNVYVFPVTLKGDSFEPVPHWMNQGKLKEKRESWGHVVNQLYGLHLKEGDLQRGYLGGVGRFHHWMQYLYRHPLSDLWRGWEGVKDDGVEYRYKVGKNEFKTIILTGEQMQKIADRLNSIPEHFKRIRWFGIFSDGQRGKTMSRLGLEEVEAETNQEREDEGWTEVGQLARFVRYEREGVVLRELARNEFGEVIYDQGEDKEGYPVWRERLGDEFLVPNAQIDFRPSKVTIGKRKRWHEPGKGL